LPIPLGGYRYLVVTDNPVLREVGSISRWQMIDSPSHGYNADRALLIE